ncbi:DUF2339 domain-containing protein [Limibaculum sp. M0105]|uniref:DUF2339 domain-containing protein n=1 Tax=Thermohalobaculum xanthum TaxID=2753746 RepID=A0A8J7M459_9RHOB|nr:DUF2339 domain-containing protein [Thermohalobaculum xanthum]MBK0398051.1 DUF2339 domain-containing protein [Thermohalobaculum xanthum]
MSLVLLVLLVLGIILAMSRQRRAEARITRLEDHVERLQQVITALRARDAADAGAEAAPSPAAGPSPAAEEPELPFGEPAGAPEHAGTPEQGPDHPAGPETRDEPEPVPARARAPHVARGPIGGAPVTAKPRKAASLEETLTSQWMVWLGALAVALSAVFLFNYAIEQGWLGPLARVTLGLCLGAALIAGGEWVHRHPIAAVGRVARADFVPAALTASGLFALFVSLFAAHALYGLIGSWAAFLALGLVSFLALALALRQGWFVALEGLVGGFLVPALLESETANALPVFLYLTIVSAGCLGLMVWRKWWWLSFLTIFFALVFWPVAWLAGPWRLGDQGVLSAYALILSALFALFSVGLPVKNPGTPATAWLRAALADTSGLGFTLSGGVLVFLAMVCEFNAPAFVFLGLYAVAGIGFGLRRAAFESLAVLGALVSAAAFGLWPPPYDVSVPDELVRLGVDRYATAFGPYVMPPEFIVFARSALAFAAVFGIGGFLAIWRAGTPAVWAVLSVAMPLYLLTLAYWRIGAFEVEVRWAVLAVGLSLFNMAAAALVPARIGPRARDVVIGFYAAGSTAALALAFTCVLREAWLTVALSLEVAALGWLWARLRVDELRLVGYLAAAAVICRLVLNYQIIEYQGSVGGLFSWVVYGYGIPGLAFIAAARFFRRDKPDPLVTLCEIAATAFLFLMVALQLRIWTSGAIDHPRYDLFDQSVQSVWWLVGAGMLLRRELAARVPWARFGGIALLALACAQILLGQVLGENPLLSAEPVGALPVLNLLGLAYLVPAVMIWFLGSVDGFLIGLRPRQLLRVASGGLLFVFITLQVRHLFWGSELWLAPTRKPGDAEIYAYSAAWILYALALLGLGILHKASFLRYASLAVLIVTVLKVFLYDMSDLVGLFRVASFLGLGLTLIGIGYVYRRFVFRE